MIDFPYSRRWPLDIVGMNLRGLAHTASTGMLLFCFGYGMEYLFSGAMMGIIYAIAFEIPSSLENFEQVNLFRQCFPFFLVLRFCPFGVFFSTDFKSPKNTKILKGNDLAELFFGFYNWFVLFICIIHYRRRPENAPSSVFANRKLLKILGGIVLFILDGIFIGSCIAYSFVVQDDDVDMHQTWFGMIGTAAIFVFIQVVYISKQIYEQCQPSSQPLLVTAQAPLITNGSYHLLQDSSRALAQTPDNSSMTASFIYFIRFVTVCASLFTLGLGGYVVYTDRVLQPCPIPWTQ